MNEKRKPSTLMLDALNPLEQATLVKLQEDPEDFTGIMATSSGLNAKVAADGLATLTFSVRIPTKMLAVLDDVVPLDLPSSVAAGRLRAALGSRPLVRLVLRRAALRLPPGAAGAAGDLWEPNGTGEHAEPPQRPPRRREPPRIAADFVVPPTLDPNGDEGD